MTTRRELLGQAAGALAGIAFTGCGLTRGAAAQTPGQARRREVVVAGKRVTTVDIHAHCHIPEALELAGQKVRFPKLVITPERIKVMDEQGIDIEALSINPNCWDKAERDLQAQIVKLQNEKVAEICCKTPDRFVGLASVALAYPDLAGEQLQDAVKRLGMRGALIGGYLPSYPDRMDAMCANRPDQCTVALKKEPSEYLKQIYIDSLIFTPEGLRHLIAEVGADQIVIGTDYPFPWTVTEVDDILNFPGLSDAERIAMLGGTAAKLLGIKA